MSPVNHSWSLWAVPAYQGRTKRIRILVDEEDFFRYREKKLKVRRDNIVFFREAGKFKCFNREIFNLTDSKDRLFFNTTNMLDMRRKNLVLKPVPAENRGRYAVQKLEN